MTIPKKPQIEARGFNTEQTATYLGLSYSWLTRNGHYMAKRPAHADISLTRTPIELGELCVGDMKAQVEQ